LSHLDPIFFSVYLWYYDNGIPTENSWRKSTEITSNISVTFNPKNKI